MLHKPLRDGIAINYHMNTKRIDRFSEYEKQTQYKTYPSARKIKFEEIMSRKDEFVRLLLNRKSRRRFSDMGIKLEVLGQLLSLSFGLNHRNEYGVQFRTYASAGARFPVEVYPIVLNSDEMEAGIYHYNVIDNSIELITGGHFEDAIKEFYANQDTISMAPCYIMFSMIYERTMNKYGERGYRFIYLDAGHMGQNLYLVSEYLGLSAVAMGGGMFDDTTIDNLLKINSYEESFFYGFAIGNPQERDEEMKLNNK